jgi:DNA-binding transcriptional ArsR family regulator
VAAAKVAKRQKFSRVPRADDLIPRLREAGLGLHVLPTYLVLCDHADNKTGRAWPKISRIARITGLCRRTIERHLSDLCEAGLVLKNHQRRSKRGRFSGCGYVVVAVLFFARKTVRHRGGYDGAPPIYKGTKPPTNAPKPPEESREERREREAKRRVEQLRDVFGPGAV